MSDNTQLDMFEQVDSKVYIKEPRGLFVLVHFPNSWDMVEGEWVPQLTEVPVVPGVNFVGGTVDNEDLSQFREWLDRKGATYINPLDTRLGEFQGFLKRRDNLFAFWKNNNEYSHHYLGCGITDEVYKVVDGKNTVTYRTDGQRYNEFRKLLVTSGIVKPITDECIKGINELKQSVKEIQMSDNTQLDIFQEMEDMFGGQNALRAKKILHYKKMLAWLDKQKQIIANEQAFFENLIETAPMVDACIYTLQMSNPPALEEVMAVTGLGKTSIYNKLKTLRATEKDPFNVVDNTYAGNPILPVLRTK